MLKKLIYRLKRKVALSLLSDMLNTYGAKARDGRQTEERIKHMKDFGLIADFMNLLFLESARERLDRINHKNSK